MCRHDAIAALVIRPEGAIQMLVLDECLLCCVLYTILDWCVCKCTVPSLCAIMIQLCTVLHPNRLSSFTSGFLSVSAKWCGYALKGCCCTPELPALSPSACFSLLADTRYKFIRFFRPSVQQLVVALRVKDSPCIKAAATDALRVLVCESDNRRIFSIVKVQSETPSVRRALLAD
jgi:hypothetical protein